MKRKHHLIDHLTACNRTLARAARAKFNFQNFQPITEKQSCGAAQVSMTDLVRITSKVSECFLPLAYFESQSKFSDILRKTRQISEMKGFD